MVIEEKTLKRLNSPAELEMLHQELHCASSAKAKTITICCGTGCLAYGGAKVAQGFKDEIKARGLENEVEVKTTGCHGFCERGPLVVLRPENILYQRVKPSDIPDVVNTVKEGKIVERLLYTIPGTKTKVIHEHDVPFYKKTDAPGFRRQRLHRSYLH